MSIPDLDPRALHGVMKMGGKKKLDALVQLLQEHGPKRVQELAEAGSLAEAKAAAAPLKSSASHLGLSALEDLCDQVLEATQWASGAALAAQASTALKNGLASLAKERAKL